MFRKYGLLVCGSLFLASQLQAQDAASQSGDPFAIPSRQGFQSAPATDAANLEVDVNRRRIADQMRQARVKMEQGQRDEALRLAARAAGMAQQWKITFAPNETSPQKLIAEIRAGSPQAAPGALAASKAPTATPASASNATQVQRQIAQDLLLQAQQDLTDNKLDAALAKIEQVRGMDVSYEVFDLRPEHLLAEMARMQPASPAGPSETLTALTSMPQTAPKARPTPAPKPELTPKEQALRLMADAKTAMQRGHLTEARELILQARQKDAAWGLLEENPEHLLAELERRTSTQVMPAGSVASTGNEEDAQRTRAAALELLKAGRTALAAGQVELAQTKAAEAQKLNASYSLFDDRPDLLMQEARMLQARSTSEPVQAAPAALAAARTPASSQEQKKQQASALLNKARAAMKAGDVATAQACIAQADALEVTYGLFEDKPESAREDLERLATTEQKKNAPAAEMASSRPGPSREALKAQATELLAAARQDLKAGRMAEAQAKADQAATFDVTYDLFEDSPERILADITGAARSQQVAQKTMPANGQLKQQAQQLIQNARKELQAGHFDSARSLAEQAATIDVTYDLFEDSPERLMSDLSTAQGLAMSPQAAPQAPANRAASAADAAGMKSQAQELLAAARADIKAGRVNEARQKLDHAATFDVTYDLFEDSPERLLAELNLIAQRGSAPGMPSSPAANASAATTPAVATANALDLTAQSRPTATAAGSRDGMVMKSVGQSAQELYDQGVGHLRDGNREAAYESFLQAYHSGEKLDTYRQQQLQDKLRELSPRRRNIQTVSNEVASSERLDAVAQQRSMEFDKLRTDCLNAIFRAEKMREKQPEQAVALLNQTLASVQAANLSEEQTTSLTAWVKSSRGSIESYMAQQAPVLELERKNTETKDLIEREIQTRVRIEQEIASLVQKFNELYDQKRFAEAHAVAKQAEALDPENPTIVTMTLKSQFALRVDRNEKLKAGKEQSFLDQLDAVEWAAVNPVARDDMPMAYPENWEELKKSRPKLPADAREHTEAEMRVRRSLSQPVSLHFNNAPLSEVLNYVADTQGINVQVEEAGLNEEGVTGSTPISINVDGIQLKSALNLILDPLNLGYAIENEVLNVTSRMRKQGELSTIVYHVADLVVPLTPPTPVSRTIPGSGYELGGTPTAPGGLRGVPATPRGGNGFAQVPANPFAGANPGMGGIGGGDPSQALAGPSQANHGFDALTDLITTTVSPENWQELGGAGTISEHQSTLSLVVRQTQKVHQEIADLLEQLRRLQDLQVTIEVRFITVSDQFFEQIGIDFDFNINDTVGNPGVNTDFSPMRPFGSVDPVFGGAGGGSSSSGAGTGGSTGSGGSSSGSSGSGTTTLAPFGQGPKINMQDHDNWPSRTVVGLLNNTQTFSPTLDVPFRQGSFDLAAPTFGGFDPNAGIQFGMAILSDIEAFMFVRAAQGDRRSNVMFAPKVTLFNGQTGTVISQLQRPFVVSLTPVASAFNIGYQPNIQMFGDGTTMTVQAVVSADRRYVRLSVLPQFMNITDVFTFSYLSGGSGGGNTGGTGGGIGGGGGGTGGGIGGGNSGGGGGGNGNNGSSSAAGTVTVQQPIQNMVSVITVVSVPDGGTVLLGGVKSLKEGRNMAGVPILNKIPYISRLFKNTGVGRETQSLMMMVTPRIIIQEEQEELLGVPPMTN